MAIGPTVLDLPSITGGLLATDVLYVVRGAGTGRDKQITADQCSIKPGTVVVGASNSVMKALGLCDYVCDGTSDDVQIQAAIDYVAGIGGGSISLTEGTYNVSAMISLAEKVRLVGQGGGTILKRVGNQASILYIAHLSAFQIQNFKIDMNGSSPGGTYGIASETDAKGSYQSITIDNFITTETSTRAFSCCSNLLNCNVGYMQQGAGAVGSAFYSCTNLINCSIDGGSTSGALYTYGFVNCSYLVNCFVKNITATTGYVGFNTCSFLNTCVVTNCTTTANSFLGFSGCTNLTSSYALTNSSSHASGTCIGFNSCLRLCSSTASSNTSNTGYGFQDCLSCFGNTGTGNTTALFNASYFSSDTSVACAAANGNA